MKIWDFHHLVVPAAGMGDSLENPCRAVNYGDEALLRFPLIVTPRVSEMKESLIVAAAFFLFCYFFLSYRRCEFCGKFKRHSPT
jgi:hypothetical protein